MSYEPYRVPHKTKLERGHGPNCKFVDYRGPACECDDKRPSDYTLMMVELGWDIDGGSGTAFVREMGPHHIRLCKVINGWQHMWIRQSGMTIIEGRGFGTLGTCLTDFWQRVASMYDSHYEGQRELYRLKMGGG